MLTALYPVTCRHHRLSLLQAGYKDVQHLKGGLSQWRYDGYPVE
jgi:rhodanese-related sulfurtransferase